MKDNNVEVESLKKRKESLQKELSAVSDKISKLVEIKFLPEYTKRYVDTYWVKQSGYGKEDVWPLYIHVRAVEDIWDTGENGINCRVVCDHIQCTSSNEIIISLGQSQYIYSLGKRITKSAYEKVKQALLKKLERQFLEGGKNERH